MTQTDNEVAHPTMYEPNYLDIIFVQKLSFSNHHVFPYLSRFDIALNQNIVRHALIKAAS